MSTMTLKEVREEMLPHVDGTGPYAEVPVVDLQEWADALSERIAADEAAVPAAFALRHESGQLVGLAFKKLGNGNGFTDVPLFTHQPAQPPIDLAAIREVRDVMERFLGTVDAWKAEIEKLSHAIGDTP